MAPGGMTGSGDALSKYNVTQKCILKTRAKTARKRRHGPSTWKREGANNETHLLALGAFDRRRDGVVVRVVEIVAVVGECAAWR
jgi:hypothetical protein